MNRWVKYALVSVLILGAATIFYKRVYIPKSTYTKVTPQEGAMEVRVFGIGNVGAKDIYDINAFFASKILKITKDAGDWVSKGELLVVMDSLDMPKLLEEAKISVKKASLELTASQKELQSLYVKKELLELTFKRYAKLKEQSFASEAEYDKAKADLDAINAQIEASKVRIDASKAEVKRAQKGVEALEIKLSHYKIYAPVDGYIIARHADVSQSVVPTQPILELVDPKGVWIKAYIDEKISGDVKVGQKATIQLRSHPKKLFEGYVGRVVPQSDIVTGEREVDVLFTQLPKPFYINEQAEVHIETKELKNVLKVPVNAIVYKNGKSGLWIDQNGKAHFQAVEILAANEDFAAIHEKLTQDIIIPSGDKKPLVEGAKVH